MERSMPVAPSSGTPGLPGPSGISLIIRDPIHTNDFRYGFGGSDNLINDGNNYDLDFTGIVPNGTKWVYLRVSVSSNTPGDSVNLFSNTHLNDYAPDVSVVAQAVSVVIIQDHFLALDGSLKAQYSLNAAGTFDGVEITVEAYL